MYWLVVKEKISLLVRNAERTHVDGSSPPLYDALSGKLGANMHY